MTADVPRVALAGASSGCGKTTVTCAVLQALVRRGLRVGAFKCGPDYIDPMFHSRITGTKCANLDLFLFNENTARFLLAKNSAGCGISVIEGVMGYYDGLGLTTSQNSTYDIVRATDTPAVLVVDAKGASLSVLAVLQGFLDFQPDSHIRGVILNRCSPSTYAALANAIRERFGGKFRPLGYLPNRDGFALESRHLGLVTAGEVSGLREKLEMMSEQAERSIDLNGLLALAEESGPVSYTPVEFSRFQEKARIGVARDRAFCFYYEDCLDALEEMGGEIVPFSPLADAALPDGLHGLYLGGGYPELYAQQLSKNLSMRRSVREALANGLPCIAECGGFMYLTEAIGEFPMAGFLPGKCFDAGRLTRFGYVRLKAKGESMLCGTGDSVHAHEFHHWDCESTGEAFTAVKASGKSWDCAYAGERLYAGFPHLHFYANPDLAVRFYKTCLKEMHCHE